MTFREYSFEIHAHRLRSFDSRHQMHLQAWVNQQIKATKKQGKDTVPLFQNFKDFFDYEKELREIEGKKKDETIVRLANLAASING